MTRCSSCQRWWSVGPDESLASSTCCKATLVPADWKSFPVQDGTKTDHNHLSKERRPEGVCPGCDLDRLAEQKARAEAKKQEPPK